MNRPHSGSFEGIRCCGAAREGRPTAKLEDVEGLSLERFREGLVVRRLALIEGLGAGSPVDAGQGDGASHEVTSKPFDADGVDRSDGGRQFSLFEGRSSLGVYFHGILTIVGHGNLLAGDTALSSTGSDYRRSNQSCAARPVQRSVS